MNGGAGGRMTGLSCRQEDTEVIVGSKEDTRVRRGRRENETAEEVTLLVKTSSSR